MLEHHVADRVAELVVDRLEIIKIAHQQTDDRIVLQREIELMIEEAPVAEPGQRVAHRLVVGVGEIAR